MNLKCDYKITLKGIIKPNPKVMRSTKCSFVPLLVIILLALLAQMTPVRKRK